MHHPESAGDPAGVRKMARLGSASAFSTVAGTGLSGNAIIPAEDLPVGASTPGLPQQHPPPQSLSLNIASQAGAQTTKKKSGFQITSVTPAQVSVSTNNSIAEDTESYDDLDESHTEDLSSSEILDASLSRNAPERSSSEETLSNFHEAETPGVMSPNQPPHHHQHLHQHSGMVNGTVHHNLHQGHPHHGQRHRQQAQSGNAVLDGGAKSPAPLGVAVAANPTPSIQKLPQTNVAAAMESVSVGTAGGVLQPPPATLGAVSGMLAATAVATGAVAAANPLLGSVGNVTSSVNGPNFGNLNASSSVGVAATPMTGSGSSVAGGSHSQHSAPQTIVTPSSSNRMGSTTQGPVGAIQCAPPQQPVAQPLPPLAAASSSRFRVVKLDSSTEPFKKGRWTCTEFYDKEAVAALAIDVAPGNRRVESVRQSGLESESTSGSSGGSSLSQYTESTGSGEPYPQQQPEYAVPLPVQPQPTAQGATQSLPHLLPQIGYTQSSQQAVAHVQVVPAVASGNGPPAAAGGFQPQPLTGGVAGVVKPQPLPSLTGGVAGVPSGNLVPPRSVQQPSAAQLEDAHRLLLQHQSLIAFNKSPVAMAGGEYIPESTTEGNGDTSVSLLAFKTLPVDGEEDSSSGASVVAIDNKIEQAMDLVKSHLMYAVREEVEVLKEQIKELIERNSQLEQENSLLKTLASPEQLAQFQAQVQSGSPPPSAQPPGTGTQPQPPASAPSQPNPQGSGPMA